jgi:predicted ATPase/class 3 adenylate cyclase
VAIKVLRAEPSQLQTSDRNLQEARSLARLRHPGIVAVHDVGIHDGQMYIVSDYIDGPNLHHWLRDNRPTWAEAARIAAAAADALAHAHSQLIVHRDVKPPNILLTTDRTPVLVDFGLALDDMQAGGGQKGVVSGTPWYMSPEQVAGSAHRIDGRTDIYSLGVVLYEMLTGRVPFRATDFQELSRQVRDDEPQPPRQLVRDIPSELERACLKALAKRQQDRYTTAADFAEDLRRVLETGAAAFKTGARSGALDSTAEPSLPRHEPLTPPSSRRRAREAERRQVTVLVCACGLFVSEAYQELDAEDQAEVMRSFQQTCEETARRFDGTVVQCNEQGLVVCFGYPVAYEDGARRAARTGLGLLEDLKRFGERLGRQHNLELNPWVGLHTGPAVVETKEDAVSLVGEARNVAIRLGEVAAAGQLVCTEATHKLLRGEFQCIGRGSRKLQGVAQAVELFRVQGVGEAQSAIEAAGPAGLTPLIGRDHEISLLKERWEQAQEGMGQVVLLIGEPGLGKSRLVHVLKEHVLGQMVEGEVDAPVIEWRCAPHFQNTGLYPAIEFYERALGFGREEPAETRFDRMLRRLEQYDLVKPETVPLWASLLSLPTTDRFPPLGLSPTRQREETFRAMLEWLHIRAARRPVLFVVEDLHWVDASTLEFLGRFLAEGLQNSILTVLTFRPEFQTPWPAVAHQTSLALTRLTRRQVGELMRKKTGGVLPEALVERVYARAGGVPLFVEEFTRMVQESGTSGDSADDGPRVAILPAREIPSTLQDLVLARLDRMESERELAQLAATLGREFSHELLAAVVGADEPTLRDQLAKLVRAEILFVKSQPPRCRYIFKHALLEDAAYNSMIKSKRQQFHRRIAEVLEARFPQTVETQPELLAHHFTEAGLPEKAIDYWLKAGLRSRKRSAENEAIGHLTRGLSLLETLDESPEGARQELGLLNALGPAYIAARGYAAPEVGPFFARARQLCEQLGATSELFAVMWGTWVWHIARGELRQCIDLAQETLAWAEGGHDRGIIGEAHHLPAATMCYRGHFAQAREHSAQAIALGDDPERCRVWSGFTGQNSAVANRCYLFLPLWHLGFPEQALRLSEETLDLARKLAHPFSLAYALHHTGWLYLQARLGAKLSVAAQQLLAIAAEQGFALWQATGTFFQGAGLLLQGKPQEAIPLLLKGSQAFRACGMELCLTYQHGTLADAYLTAGRWDEARRALDDALSFAEKNDERCHEAELHRLKGELLLAESRDQTAAEDCFRRAIEVARRQQSRAWELRATMSLARLRQRQGRRAEARTELAGVSGTYTEGFTTPDLVDAAALLCSLA